MVSCLAYSSALKMKEIFPPKGWPVSDLHGVTSQNTVLFIVLIAMRTSNPKYYRNIFEIHILRNENASVSVREIFS